MGRGVLLNYRSRAVAKGLLKVILREQILVVNDELYMGKRLLWKKVRN